MQSQAVQCRISYSSWLHLIQAISFLFSAFQENGCTPCITAWPVTDLAFSGSQASGLCAYPVFLFLHSAYYEPEVYSGVALSEIRSRVQENVLVCVPMHTCACVAECVYLQCYYSSLTEFTLSSKSAGWCNKGV